MFVVVCLLVDLCMCMFAALHFCSFLEQRLLLCCLFSYAGILIYAYFCFVCLLLCLFLDQAQSDARRDASVFC